MSETLLLQIDPTALTNAINYMWVLVVTFLIFFMHAGFAMLEAGQVRSKNVANQCTKNMLTWCIGVLAFFLIGAGVKMVIAAATGPGEIGAFFGLLGPESSLAWVDWLFGAVFAMTSATIVSGAVAGRMKLRAYVTYTFLLAAVIYPVVVGLTWGGGYLAEVWGFKDFAGGMIVHGLGGIAGLTAAWVIGPRFDRFNDDGTANVIPGHSVTFAVLGTLILCFGWYGFNVGTAAAPLAEGATALKDFGYVGRVALTTTLGMVAGGIGAGGMALLKTKKVDTLYVANGMLAGLVGITSNTNLITWYGALVIGVLAGAQLPLVFELLEKHLQIDDVCAVFPVHGSAGILGTLLVGVPLFTIPGADVSFGGQLVGVVVIGVWAFVATAAVFGTFRTLGQLRVTREHEREGLDIAEHGVDTYPEFGVEEAPITDGGRVYQSNSNPSDETIRTDGGLANDGDIKLVMAYVRPDKLASVKQGLANIGAPSLTVTNVSGRGSQPAKKGQWRGEEYTVDLHQKVKIECIVADIPAADVVEAISEAARTGDPGDGKVFVLPVEQAHQVRTGKDGRDAV